GGKAFLHAPGDERQVGALAPLLVPALEHGGEKIKLGEDVAEAGGKHLLALERAAQGEQRHVDGEREGRGVAGKPPVVAARLSRRRRPRKKSAGPSVRPRAQRVGKAMAHMRPERAVELLEPA